MAIVKRLVKGSPLTHAEMDNNWDEVTNVWTELEKKANDPRANTNTLTDDTIFQFPVVSGRTYMFEITIFFDAPTTPGFKWGLAGPTNSYFRTERRQRRPGIFTFENNTVTFDTSYPTNQTLAGNANPYGALWIEGTFVATASGTFSFQWSQINSNATATTMNVGSKFKYRSFVTPV